MLNHSLSGYEPNQIGFGLTYTGVIVNPFIKKLIKAKRIIQKSLFVEDPSENLLPSEKIERYSRQVREMDDIDEANPDEVLRQSGFYDSSDKRCCINRKKR